MAPAAYGAVDDSTSKYLPLSPIPEVTTDRSEGSFRRNTIVTETPPRTWQTKVAVIMCSFAVVAITAMAHAGYNDTQTKSIDARLSTETTTPRESRASRSHPLAFTAVNFYHIRDGTPAQDYPWLKDVKLIEPYRETTLAVTNSKEGMDYRWSVREGGTAGDVYVTASGAEATVSLTKLNENVIVLEEVNMSTGAVSRRLDESVMVKYVRREIRTLTDDEREELLDAMAEIWKAKVKDGDGREMYGDSFSDIWAINRLHYKAASPQTCDHFHDGLGFLTNHALLSNTFEYSLQMVNPKLTLPYWDFTIETSAAGSIGEDTSFESQTKTPLLQASWFGSYDPDDNMVKDGRWAYTEIPTMMTNNPGDVEPDVYSKLRAPWNVNNRPYLTRGLGKMCNIRVEEAYPWPTCEMHYELATAYTDFYSWVWASSYDPHGPVHIWIGGVLDCEDTYHEIAELVGKDIATALASFSFVHRKDMFRSGFFRCEGTVDVTEEPQEVFASGTCGCLDYDLTQGDDYVAIFESMVLMEEYVGHFDDDTKRSIVSILCSAVINDGDQLQASSSLDPTFWPAHPTMERLWMFSVLTGRVTDFSWPESDVTYTASDGTTYSEIISVYSDQCMGHRGSDVFPFGLLESDTNDFTVRTGIRGNPSEGGNTLTNIEVLAAFDPRVNALPYVYDTFRWDHCTADGFIMEDAWKKEGEEVRATAGGKTEASVAGRRKTVGGRTVFEKGTPRYPMYDSLVRKTADFARSKDV